MINVLITLLVTITTTFIIGMLAGYFLHLMMHTRFARMRTLRSVSKSHMVHHSNYTIHDFESETYRSSGKDDSALAFVPVITLVVGLMCIGFWIAFQSWWIYPVIVVEGVVVGIANEKIHEYFHIKDHWMNKYAWFRELKRLHFLHHKHPKYNHGIIWLGLDKLFGTFRKN